MPADVSPSVPLRDEPVPTPEGLSIDPLAPSVPPLSADVVRELHEANELAAEAAGFGTNEQHQAVQRELDAMWERMKLHDGDDSALSNTTAVGRGVSTTAPTAQPPPGASREEIKRYRAAIRKAAIENVRKTTAETAELAARHAMLQRAKQKQPAGS